MLLSCSSLQQVSRVRVVGCCSRRGVESWGGRPFHPRTFGIVMSVSFPRGEIILFGVDNEVCEAAFARCSASGKCGEVRRGVFCGITDRLGAYSIHVDEEMTTFDTKKTIWRKRGRVKLDDVRLLPFLTDGDCGLLYLIFLNTLLPLYNKEYTFMYILLYLEFSSNSSHLISVQQKQY